MQVKGMALSAQCIHMYMYMYMYMHMYMYMYKWVQQERRQWTTQL